MTPERAAEVIWTGVLANRPRVLVGGDARAIDWFSRLVGARYQRVFSVLSRRLSP
jgi:hypothetical protein